MNDDWSTPTGEHEQPWLAEPANGERYQRAAPHDENIDPAFGVTEGELRMVDVFFYEAALEIAREPRVLTEEEQDAIADLRTRADRLKTMTLDELEAERQRLLRTGG